MCEHGLDVSHMTRSSANSMAQGGSVSISEASTSMMMMKSGGLIADCHCKAHQFDTSVVVVL